MARRSNTGISGVRKHGKRFLVTWTDADGKKHRQILPTRAAAIFQKNDVETKKALGQKTPELVKKNVYTFGKLASDALAAAKNRIKSWEQSETHLKFMLPEFGDEPADALTTADFETFLDELQAERELSGATINRYRSTLQMLYTWANRHGKLTVHPARYITRRWETRGVIRCLSYEEQDRLMKELDPWKNLHTSNNQDLRIEFLFALWSGVRRGEQYNLKWADVDLRERQALIRDPKNGEERHVELDSKLIPLLEMLPRSSSHVFARGVTLSRKRHMKWFENACKRANVLNFRWHDIRHTCASRLAQEKVPLLTIQKIMGHKSVLTTQRYAHIMRADIREAIESQRPVSMPREERIVVN